MITKIAMKIICGMMEIHAICLTVGKVEVILNDCNIGGLQCPITARRYVSVSVTRRSVRQLSRYSPAGEPYNCPGASRVRRAFCCHGTKRVEHYAHRGTKVICWLYTNPRANSLMGSAGAVRIKSRYDEFCKCLNANAKSMTSL